MSFAGARESYWERGEHLNWDCTGNPHPRTEIIYYHQLSSKNGPTEEFLHSHCEQNHGNRQKKT